MAGPVVPPCPCPAHPGGLRSPSEVSAAGHGALCTARCSDSLSRFLQSALPVPVWHSQKGALWAQNDGDRDIVPWVPLAVLWGRPPLQAGQALPYCCAAFVTLRLMLVIGSFYHLNVSSQLLKTSFSPDLLPGK